MWLGIILSRGGLIAMAILAALAWIRVHDYTVRKDEQSRVVAKMEKAADAKTSKAETARRSVDRIPDERLRDKFFRD